MKEKFKLSPAMIAIPFTFIGITAAGLYFHQDFYRILPLYVSLVVGLLNAGVNRFGPLLGGLNSILYAVVYFSYGLYGQAAYALLFSCTLQLLTFFRWSRHRAGYSTVLRKMNAKTCIGVAILFAVVWAGVYAVTSLAGGSYAFLDTTTTMVGILSAFLMLLSFVEYTWLNVPSAVVSLVLYLTMLKDNPEQLTYVIYSIFSLLCAVMAFVTARKMMKKQEENA